MWKISNCVSCVSKVKELVRRGIPNHLRGIAWQVGTHTSWSSWQKSWGWKNHKDEKNHEDDANMMNLAINVIILRCWVERGTASLVGNSIRNILRQPVLVRRPFIGTLLGEDVMWCYHQILLQQQQRPPERTRSTSSLLKEEASAKKLFSMWWKPTASTIERWLDCDVDWF